MTKLQSYKRIISSDFEEKDKQLVEQLADSLNTVIDDMQYALNNKLSLTDNIYCSVRDVTLTVDASGNVADTRVNVGNVTVPVKGTNVILVTNLSNPAIYPVGQPFISFTQLSGGIMINNITGLLPNYRWSIRFIAWN